MLLEHERNYDLGMIPLVSECSWNTNGIMVWKNYGAAKGGDSLNKDTSRWFVLSSSGGLAGNQQNEGRGSGARGKSR